jgi:hypothetical protein
MITSSYDQQRKDLYFDRVFKDLDYRIGGAVTEPAIEIPAISHNVNLEKQVQQLTAQVLFLERKLNEHIDSAKRNSNLKSNGRI